MNEFDPSQLQQVYQQAQQYAQQNGVNPMNLLQGAKDPRKMAQALMQFQQPQQDALSQQYGIQPGPSMI